jgi:hypothetical protein
MIPARLLVELGVPPEEAINSVRIARKGAIETLDQEDVVRQSKTRRWQILEAAAWIGLRD